MVAKVFKIGKRRAGCRLLGCVGDARLYGGLSFGKPNDT